MTLGAPRPCPTRVLDTERMPRRKGSAAVRNRTPRSADRVPEPSPLLLEAQAESAVAVRLLLAELAARRPRPARMAAAANNALRAVAFLATMASAAARRNDPQ